MGVGMRMGLRNGDGIGKYDPRNFPPRCHPCLGGGLTSWRLYYARSNTFGFCCNKKVGGFDMAPSIMAGAATATVTSGAIPEIRNTKRARRVTFADVSPTANEQVLSSPIYFAVCCLLSGSHAYAIESLKSILKNSPRKGDKDPREFDRTRDTDRYGHMVRYTDQSLRGKRGRDTDSDSDDDSYHMSRSHLRVRYKHRLSGFDIAPPASATSFSDGAVTAPTVHGMFQNMPVQLMTQHATRHARHVYVGGISSTVKEQSVVTFFSYVMATIGGNTAGPCDAVVNVYINLEEASNAIALDGIMFEGAPVKVKRPSDYNKSLAATLGPSEPNSNLNLAAVGLKPGSAAEIIFVAGIPYSLTEAQIRELLETFGALQGFNLVKDKETGNSKGYAFCVFQDLSVTDIACATLNGLKIGNKILMVRRANKGQTQPKPELESILLHAQQQIALQKMMLQSGAISTTPTKVLSLTQAVTEKELVNDEYYEDILEDMKTECGQFGTLVNVIIPRPNPNGNQVSGVGKVFLEYADTESSTKARAGLYGKKFECVIIPNGYDWKFGTGNIRLVPDDSTLQPTSHWYNGSTDPADHLNRFCGVRIRGMTMRYVPNCFSKTLTDSPGMVREPIPRIA
ncbi:splicing factor U2af large subunit B isoform X3 [Tanacetum coccineum]|uniref:Splicing factor U2af large subunit B isoform X3 n=1 Tax=Tanacetum coccineum TaxID=301880 RepID=A0ABQ5FEP3_9ASTR